MGAVPRDAGAWTEISGRVALAEGVPSPASDAAIGSECDGVAAAPCNAGAWTEIRGRVALAVDVVSPASDEAISVRVLSNHPCAGPCKERSHET